MMAHVGTCKVHGVRRCRSEKAEGMHAQMAARYEDMGRCWFKKNVLF